MELADITQAAPYLEMGVKHFSHSGWDVYASCTTNGAPMARVCCAL